MGDDGVPAADDQQCDGNLAGRSIGQEGVSGRWFGGLVGWREDDGKCTCNGPIAFRTPRRPRPVKGARNAFYLVLNFCPCAEGRPTTQGGELQSGVRKVRQNMSCVYVRVCAWVYVCVGAGACVCGCGCVCVCRRAVTLCDVRPLARTHGRGTKTLRGVMRTTTGSAQTNYINICTANGPALATPSG